MSHAETGRSDVNGPRRSLAALLLLGVLAVLAFAGLVWLGDWQISRRAWKLDLIDRVESRVNAPATDLPARTDWAGVTAAKDEYRRVKASGTYLARLDTLVQATTNLGAGFWVITPMQTDQGFVVLVNRGFVPQDARDRASRIAGEIQGPATLTGLLRMSEPKGGFLHVNDPSDGRWYSRDVAAIAAARGLIDVAPYFIDADATPNQGGLPVGGLTVIAFPNSHLVYAITWYALAFMLAAAVSYFILEEWREHRG